MFSNEGMKNLSLVLYPERLKTREGYLLGINLTEFVVVVLDVIEFNPGHMDIKMIKKLLDHYSFKNVVSRLVNVVRLTIERDKSAGMREEQRRIGFDSREHGKSVSIRYLVEFGVYPIRR